MNAVKVPFKFCGDKRPVGYKDIKCHPVFDIKWILQGKLVLLLADPNVPIYASVVSRESVRILLTVASLNNLDIKAADISNAFLSDPCAEHVCFRAGPEFGDKEGQ